jgi:hypothetical protein
MSFSTTVRRSFYSTGRASYSQSAPSKNATASPSIQAVPKNKKRQHTLPREKLRALISLYHQSDTFITQDNLVEEINKALLPKLRAERLGKDRVDMPSYDSFKRISDERKNAPKVTDVWAAKHKGSERYGMGNAAQWSAGGRSTREVKVIEALYGVNMSSPNSVRPGLEAVEAALEQDQYKGPSRE